MLKSSSLSVLSLKLFWRHLIVCTFLLAQFCRRYFVWCDFVSEPSTRHLPYHFVVSVMSWTFYVSCCCSHPACSLVLSPVWPALPARPMMNDCSSSLYLEFHLWSDLPGLKTDYSAGKTSQPDYATLRIPFTTFMELQHPLLLLVHV